MTAKVNIFNLNWCNLLFQGRNRQYGAYELRQLSSERHMIALLMTVTLFILSLTVPSVVKKVLPRIPKPDVNTNVTIISTYDPDDQPFAPVTIEEPPALIRNTIAFTPPKITNGEVAEGELMKIQDEILNSKAKVSTSTYTGGTDELDAKEIDELNNAGRIIVEDTTSDPPTFVEQMPQYPGGNEEFLRYIAKNIKYPQMAIESQIQGKVFVEFVVNTSGDVSNVKVLRGISGGCDEEAVRVIKTTHWIPGKQNGKLVRVKFTIPVIFLLSENR